MAIDFPSSPSVSQEFSAADKVYVWDGEKWLLKTLQESNLSKALASTQILTAQFFA